MFGFGILDVDDDMFVNNSDDDTFNYVIENAENINFREEIKNLFNKIQELFNIIKRNNQKINNLEKRVLKLEQIINDNCILVE